MPVLSDDDIRKLIKEQKPFPKGIRPLLPMRQRQGHFRRDFDFASETGSRFRVIVRQLVANPLDFSVILAYYLPGTYTLFRLRRYNGRGHHHTNVLEKQEAFYDFHIHTATERYQAKGGLREEGFAERTNRFCDLTGAIDCLLVDCGFTEGMEGTPLFPGERT